MCTPAVWKVLSVIVRQTYGWHKNFDCISISQLELKTGLSNGGLRNSIDTLKNSGLLIRGKLNKHGWEYKIDLDCDLNRAAEVLSGVSLSDRATMSLSDIEGCHSVTGGMSLSDNTKETNTKETSKESTPEKSGALPNCELDRYSSAKGLGEMAGMSSQGYSLHILLSAIDQGKRRWPELRNEEVADQIAALWKEYVSQPTHVKVSIKNFMDTVGRYIDSDDWKAKPKENGHVVDEHGGHFEGTVYVTKDGKRMPGYKPLPTRKPEGIQ